MSDTEEKRVKKKSEKPAKIKDPRKKKKVLYIGVFVIGVVMLIVGAVFLVLGLMRGAAVADGEYLVAAKNWTLTDCENDDCDKVVWNFTEIGKGTLTTDGGEHNYDFKWAIEDGKLLIQTDWLYELNDEYNYSLNQGSSVLTLVADDEVEYKFVAQASE